MASSLVPMPRLAADAISEPAVLQENEADINSNRLLTANPPTGVIAADGSQAVTIVQNL